MRITLSENEDKQIVVIVLVLVQQIITSTLIDIQTKISICTCDTNRHICRRDFLVYLIKCN